MSRTTFVTPFVLLMGLFLLSGCPIGPADPLGGFGAPCAVREGTCDLEHVCQPRAAGALQGVCIPVKTFGACDEDEPVTHAPGRQGEQEDVEILSIESAEQAALLDNVRAVTGRVQVFKQGQDNVKLGDLCSFRALQSVGDGLGIGDSDVTTLDGLQSFTSASGGVAIFDNTNLTNLDGLANLTAITTREVGDNGRFDVLIAGNPALPPATVARFVSQLKERVGRDLVVVACNNGGQLDCSATDRTLLTSLIQNGLAILP